MNEMKAIKSGIVGVATVVVLTVGGFVFFEKIYKGYQIIEIDIKYYEMTGWHVYLKMWRI